MDCYFDSDSYMDAYFYSDSYCYMDRYSDGYRYVYRFFPNEINDRKFPADVRDGARR